jgi:DNA-binding winged helix-turn-helix (wHTH) protein
MSALHEKIALRRLLQDFVHQLDETIVDLMTVESKESIPCHFGEDGIVMWQDRQHVFNPSTYMLLKQFFDAPNLTLSKEDVRQDVLNDDDASEGSIRQCILEARKELRRCQFPYRIETIVRKGYRLVAGGG